MKNDLTFYDKATDLRKKYITDNVHSNWKLEILSKLVLGVFNNSGTLPEKIELVFEKWYTPRNTGELQNTIIQIFKDSGYKEVTEFDVSDSRLYRNDYTIAFTVTMRNI